VLIFLQVTTFSLSLRSRKTQLLTCFKRIYLRMMNRKYSVFLLFAAAFIAGIFFVTAGANWLGFASLTGASSEASSSGVVSPLEHNSYRETARAPSLNDFNDAFISVAETVNPAVVQIRTERLIEGQNPFQAWPFEPFEGTPFEDMFRQPDRENQPQPSTALGSGVIVRENGYIVTNNHVIENAEELTVILIDGRQLSAEIVGTDASSDLAVIRVAETGLPVLSLDEGALVRVGEWVMAFGSPLSNDLGNTVTAGIVSAVRRTSARLSSLNLYASFIQTDAAINPGNSGGPLVNLDGQLVGINSAIYSRSGGNQGIGFTIPVDVVQNVANQLITNGAVARGGLGVRFTGVSRTLAEALGVPQGAAQITEVLPNSVAERAGIKAGDVVTAIDGRQLREFNELRTTVGNRLPGDTMMFSIVRDGSEREVQVTLGDLSRYNEAQAAPQQDAQPEADQEDATDLGFGISELTDQSKSALGLGDSNVRGVIISSIDPSSAAFRDADLARNDIITAVNGEDISSPEEFNRAYRSVKPGDTFLIQVLRVGNGLTQKFYTALKKPE
jgi:serine protease Do